MQRRDLPNERQSEPYAAVRSAARLVDTKKRLKDALSVLFGYSRTLILDSQEHAIVVFTNRDIDLRVGMTITDGVFNEVKHQPVEQGVVADCQAVSAAIEGNVFILGKWRKVGEDLFDQWAQLDRVLAR